MHRIARLALLAALLAGCATLPSDGYRDTDVPISSAAAFDVQRYAGLWYEIARFPVPFQADCEAVTARYTANSDGTVGVLNTCRDGAVDGPERQIRGSAEIVGPGRLSVGFQGVPFIKGPYWVLWVDEGYRTAVVGVPSGRAGWILNRAPEIPSDRLKAALEILDFNGYDTKKLRWTAQPPAP
jgi:apolipoprotein D and lipocalin family protein